VYVGKDGPSAGAGAVELGLWYFATRGTKALALEGPALRTAGAPSDRFCRCRLSGVVRVATHVQLKAKGDCSTHGDPRRV